MKIMANDSLNISIPLKFEVKSPPRGMTDYDPKALTVDQQNQLNSYKLNLRKENVVYLAAHPEVKAIVSMIVRMTIIRNPRDIIQFVANLFTRPDRQIRKELDKILKETNIEFEAIPPSYWEDWDY